MMNDTKICFIAAIALLGIAIPAAAEQKLSKADVALLPTYCQGTHFLREITKVPTSVIEQYLKTYGHSYNHLHHYCWALDDENKSYRIFDRVSRDNTLRHALPDVDYVLNNADPDFVLLPEIYSSKARMLFRLHREPEAVLALNKAIQLKPNYLPAYLRLSDYYVDKGDKATAIKILEQGLDQVEGAPRSLVRRLEKLGKVYERKQTSNVGAAASSVDAHDAPQTEAAPPVSPNVAPEEDKPEQPVSEATDKPNPYCRFCP